MECGGLTLFWILMPVKMKILLRNLWEMRHGVALEPSFSLSFYLRERIFRTLCPHCAAEAVSSRSAGFPACGFTGLSSLVCQERATGKSPEPAGWKACATIRVTGREQ